MSEAGYHDEVQPRALASWRRRQLSPTESPPDWPVPEVTGAKRSGRRLYSSISRPSSTRAIWATLLTLLFVASSVVVSAPDAGASCPTGPNNSPSGPSCPALSLTITIPTGPTGASLASVEFNGTFYTNGSQVSPLVAGYPYTFSATNISQGYALDHWGIDNGTMSNEFGPTNVVTLCSSPPCSHVVLALNLASDDHSLIGGDAYSANAVSSITATFSVPAIAWWKVPRSPNPQTGSVESVDWGVGIGGVSAPSAIVVGLQLNLTVTNNSGILGYSSSIVPFWSTSIHNAAGQSFFKLSAGQNVSPGDQIDLGVEPLGSCQGAPPWWNCTSGPSVEISDLAPHAGKSWSFSTAPNLPAAVTGEWMAWHPQGVSGSLAPSYTKGNFSNLTLNGANVYPTGLTLPNNCAPFPQCTPTSPPSVSYTEWLGTSSGWNESLTPGNLSWFYLHPSGHLSYQYAPAVSTLANVLIYILPFNASNELHPLQVSVGNALLGNGAQTQLTYATYAPLNAIGYHMTNLRVTFAKWGTTAGTLANPLAQETTLLVSQPGALEALMLAIGPSWSGYANATQYRTTTSAAGEFVVPQTSYNMSVNASGKLQEIGIWVGLGGYVGALWQAGIILNYSTAGVLTFHTFYEYVGPKGGGPFVIGPAAYVITFGDTIVVTVSTCPAPRCSGGKDTWSVVDLSKPPYPGQPSGSGSFENWSGSLAGYPVDTNTTEWVAESPSGTCGIQPQCILPALSTSITFSQLWVDALPQVLFGPYQAQEAFDIHPINQTASFTQRLVPVFLCSPSSTSFSIRES